MAVLVDSNVIIDIITEDKNWYEWSSEHLEKAANSHQLIINAIIYAEVSVTFLSMRDVDVALPKDLYAREALPYAAGFMAAKAFVSYRRAGGKKTSPMPDFYIGAHALAQGYLLLTRDPRRYAPYFPKLKLICP